MDALFKDSLFLANVTDLSLRLVIKLKISQSRSKVILIYIKCMLTPPEQTQYIYENIRASVGGFYSHSRVNRCSRTIYWRLQVLVELRSWQNAASGVKRKTQAYNYHKEMGI